MRKLSRAEFRELAFVAVLDALEHRLGHSVNGGISRAGMTFPVDGHLFRLFFEEGLPFSPDDE